MRMPRFRYSVFLWIFAAGNAVVWFFILSGLGRLVFEHFAKNGGLARDDALTFFALAPLVSAVLACQGAVVNLRAQYLIGRFHSPAAPHVPSPVPVNAWLVSLQSGLPVAAVLAPVTILILRFSLPPVIDRTATARVIGGIGAAMALGLALTIAPREFRRFQFHLGASRRHTASAGRYVWGHLAAPWGLVNGSLNGVFAWMLYHQGPGHPASLVNLGELRHDLVVTTFLVSALTVLAVIPEVETDFAAGLTPPADGLTPMPVLALRYLLAVALAGTVWVLVTLSGSLAHTAAIRLSTVITIKTGGGGALAAFAAAQGGRWTLARCHLRATAATAARV
jgi:hypothetical protein